MRDGAWMPDSPRWETSGNLIETGQRGAEDGAWTVRGTSAASAPATADGGTVMSPPSVADPGTSPSSHGRCDPSPPIDLKGWRADVDTEFALAALAVSVGERAAFLTDWFSSPLIRVPEGEPSVVASTTDLVDLQLGVLPEDLDLDMIGLFPVAVADAATSTTRVDVRAVACLTSTSNRDVATAKKRTLGRWSRWAWVARSTLPRTTSPSRPPGESEIDGQPISPGYAKRSRETG